MKSFETFENKVIIDIEINGKLVKGLLDSGANKSSIRKNLVTWEIVNTPATVKGASGKFVAMSTQIEKLTFLETTHSIPDCLVCGDEVFDIYRPDIDFIIGNDLLQNANLVIDFRFNQIGFGRVEPLGTSVILPIEKIHGVNFLTAELGDVKIVAFLDLGAAINVVNTNSKLLEQEKLVQIGGFAISDSSAQLMDSKIYKFLDLKYNHDIFGTFLFTTIDLENIEEIIGKRFDIIIGFSSMSSSMKVWNFQWDSSQLTISDGYGRIS